MSAVVLNPRCILESPGKLKIKPNQTNAINTEPYLRLIKPESLGAGLWDHSYKSSGCF